MSRAAGLLIAVSLIAAVGGALYWTKTPSAQTTACVQSRSCLPSYANTAICETLPIGTPESELVFRLGQPMQEAGAVLYFPPGALESGPIRVELDQARKAKRFVCRAN
jgi:hypothetical protein